MNITQFCFIYMFIGILLACVYVHHVCASCLKRPEEGVGTLGTGVTVVGYHVCAKYEIQFLWKSNKYS